MFVIYIELMYNIFVIFIIFDRRVFMNEFKGSNNYVVSDDLMRSVNGIWPTTFSIVD